jgi:hypothetical protein
MPIAQNVVRLKQRARRANHLRERQFRPMAI